MVGLTWCEDSEWDERADVADFADFADCVLVVRAMGGRPAESVVAIVSAWFSLR